MEALHVLAAAAIGIIMTLLSFFDDVFIEAKLNQYLNTRITLGSIAAEASDTIKSIASGASFLVAYSASTIVFVVNCFLALTLYESKLQQIIYISVMAPMIILTMLGLLHVMTRYELADFTQYFIGGRSVAFWLRWVQFGFNVITFASFGLGLYLRSSSFDASH